jgi:hypothetical protein
LLSTHNTSNTSSTQSTPFALFNTLADIVLSINRIDLFNQKYNLNTSKKDQYDPEQNEIYAAHNLKRALNSHNWYIESEEHDCHEFLHLLIDVVDEEQSQNKMSLSSLNYFQPSHLREMSRVNSMKNPFHGYLANQLQCLDCDYKVNKKFFKINLEKKG